MDGEVHLAKLDRLIHAFLPIYRQPPVQPSDVLVDKPGTLGVQPLDYLAVVHDLMPDIDRRPVFLEGPLDDLDRSLDPRTKAPRLRQNNVHSNSRSAVSGGSSPPGTGHDYTRN